MLGKKKNIVILVLFLIPILLNAGQGAVLANPNIYSKLETQAFIPNSPMIDLLITEIDDDISSDGRDGGNTQLRKYVVVDTNEASQGIQYPAETDLSSRAGGATFAITYVANGGTDDWGKPCYTFPEEAKTAINYAAAIWAAKLYSPVPITIRACWANFGDGNILGYSGGGTLVSDFPGAPMPSTVYSASLANALSGNDLDPTNEDMHITYNMDTSWYYGLDGNPGAGKFDLVTAVAQEIAHGLNFSGSVYKDINDHNYYWGYGVNYPNIYDTFMRDNSGNLLTSFAPGSEALGTLLTSNSLWFHGSNAMAANGSSRVKMFAPENWESGISYNHLDYATFSGTINSMMVWALASNSSQHNTGPVTDGLLKDLGWTSEESGPYYAYLPLLVNGTRTIAPPNPILNSDFELGQVYWAEFSAYGFDIVMVVSAPPPHSGTWLAWLGGSDYETSWISQSVTVPVDKSILHFWYYIESTDACGHDYYNVYINGSNQVHWNLCESENTYGWVEGTLDLTAWAGTIVTLKFEGVTDSNDISSMFLDDISLEATSRTTEPLLFDGLTLNAAKLCK